MAFRPLFSRDRFWAGLLALLGLILSLWALRGMLRYPVGPQSVLLGWAALVLLGLTALLLYRLWALHSLDYWVQRDAIHILWHGEEAIIPLRYIREIRVHPQLPLRPSWRHWPEPWIQWDADTHTLAYATQPPQAAMAIITQEETYLISPENPEAFLAAYRERRDFGPARQRQPLIYLAPWRQHWLLHDRGARALLVGGLLLGLLLLSYTAWHYPQLPPTVALHVNAQGLPDFLSPRRAIFLIPGFTLLMGFLNAAIGFALYETRRFLSYLLWSTSVVLQIIAFIIILDLIP